MSTPIESSSALGAASGLPLVNQALEPAAVRNGSPATQKAYASALDFEQMLVQQLSQSLVSTTGLEGSGEQGSSEEGSAAEGGGESLAGMGGAANSQLASMLPQALTEGVMSQGGLGLAQQLMTQLEPDASTATPNAGTSGAATTSTASATSAPTAVGGAGGVAA
jgi:Rod binding domain-containing protein